MGLKLETLQTTTPAVLHHLHLASADPERLSRFYAHLLELSLSRDESGSYVLAGGQRHLLVSKGADGTPAFIAFAVRDVDGNKLELSAELETFAPDQPPRVWPNTEYTLNYWGSAWMRS